MARNNNKATQTQPVERIKSQDSRRRQDLWLRPLLLVHRRALKATAWMKCSPIGLNYHHQIQKHLFVSRAIILGLDYQKRVDQFSALSCRELRFEGKKTHRNQNILKMPQIIITNERRSTEMATTTLATQTQPFKLNGALSSGETSAIKYLSGATAEKSTETRSSQSGHRSHLAERLRHLCFVCVCVFNMYVN